MWRLCGFPPFSEDSNEKLFEMIKKGQYDFPSPQWDDISSYGWAYIPFSLKLKLFFWTAKDLIKNLLQVDPKKRYNADQILKHPWIVGDVTPRKSLPIVTTKIKEFNAKRRLKVLASSFLFFIKATSLSIESSIVGSCRNKTKKIDDLDELQRIHCSNYFQSYYRAFTIHLSVVTIA